MPAAEFRSVEIAIRKQVAQQGQQRGGVLGKACGLQPGGDAAHADIELHAKSVGSSEEATFWVVRLDGERVGGVVVARPGGPVANGELQANVDQGSAVVFEQEDRVGAHLPVFDGWWFGCSVGGEGEGRC